MSSSALVSAIVLMIGLPITRAPAITIQVHSMVTFTKWSNENHGGTSFFRNCPVGSFVQSLQWKEQFGYGIVDVEMDCGFGHKIRYSGNRSGFWNEKRSCSSDKQSEGISRITAMEKYGSGIVNVRTKCFRGDTRLDSNRNTNGNWNRELECPEDSRLIGLNVREQRGQGIINFQAVCGARVVKPRGESTRWSNSNHGGNVISQSCPEGRFVRGLQWKERYGYGLVDLKMTCGEDTSVWGPPVVFTNYRRGGHWNEFHMCVDKPSSLHGYYELQGREESGNGIVNMRSWCYFVERAEDSNRNYNGNWNEPVRCRNGTRVVGITVREHQGNGIVNFRAECGE